MKLPTSIDPVLFDDGFRLDSPAWSPAVLEVCAAHGFPAGQIAAFSDGSNLVAAVNGKWVVKIFPPFHLHQWESERRVLPRLYGRLPLRVPELLAEGCRDDGWPYLIIERLPGVLLESCWTSLDREERVAVLEQVGATMAAVHRIHLGDVATLAPEWSQFIRGQATNCRARHARYGMPDWLLDGVEALVKDRLPSVERAEERVILTGEYTPFNLLVDNESGRVRLTGMFDFGDAMVGPPEYDLLGPSLFSCAGDAELVAALFRGYHGRERRIDRATRMRLLALAVLHRYANLDFQLRISGWRERARSLEELAVLIWPDGEAP